MSQTKSHTLNAGQIRQGDVLLVKIDKGDDGEREPLSADGSTVLAHGEVTGHRHRLLDADGVVQTRANRQLTLMRTTALLHEEHAPVDVPSGAYDLPRQVEWNDDLEPRTVAD